MVVSIACRLLAHNLRVAEMGHACYFSLEGELDLFAVVMRDLITWYGQDRNRGTKRVFQV